MSNKISAPEGMSCVNAFRALWCTAKPNLSYRNDPEKFSKDAKAVDTADKVAALFQSQTYFGYVGGKMLKVDFSFFPEMNILENNQYWDAQAAEQALYNYKKTPSSKRFDVNDSYDFKVLTSYRYTSSPAISRESSNNVIAEPFVQEDELQ